MTNYESVLDQISAVPNAPSDQLRDIGWLTPAKTVGVARDRAGHLEVFLAGPKLEPRSRTIDESLEFHAWHRSDGAPLEANRLLLPALGHFDQVGAFVANELLRNGADQDPASAFAATEPIIELAVKRLLMSQAAMLGLAGELLLLDALCRRTDDVLVGQVVSSWHGWRRSTRDLTWDGTGVEVKTTSRAISAHMIQGIHQLEPDIGTDGEPGEDRLLLVSIGLQEAAPSSNTFSIPMLVDRIIGRLDRVGNTGDVAALLMHVATYGSESGFGYEHVSMSTDAPFTNHFAVTFFRGYDMADPAIEVLRRDDVAVHHHVELQSLRFNINLPATISYQNPISGMNRVALRILEGVAGTETLPFGHH